MSPLGRWRLEVLGKDEIIPPAVGADMLLLGHGPGDPCWGHAHAHRASKVEMHRMPPRQQSRHSEPQNAAHRHPLCLE